MGNYFEAIIALLVVVCVTAADSLKVDDQVLVVNVQRFEGNIEECREREVCADVFNFTRDHGDGTGNLESRFIQNCRCPPGTAPCGQTGSQLMFKETTKQSMITCEDATEFSVCEDGEIAKEQHNLGNYVYYKINCICANNGTPGDFRNKMTREKRWNEMTPDERLVAQENPRSRFYMCNADKVVAHTRGIF